MCITLETLALKMSLFCVCQHSTQFLKKLLLLFCVKYSYSKIGKNSLSPVFLFVHKHVSLCRTLLVCAPVNVPPVALFFVINFLRVGSTVMFFCLIFLPFKMQRIAAARK